MDICRSMAFSIGNTPLVRLHRLERELGLRSALLGKCEFMNPSGSAKDRPALFMLRDGISRGLLSPGGAVIEPTSGNMGISLAMLGACLRYSVLLTMPDTMSRERIVLMEAYGARVVLTPGLLGMAGAIARAEALGKELPGSFLPRQFHNPANPRSHYETTGPELYRAAGKHLDYLVAGVGTGGTVTGTGGFLKTVIPGLRIVAIEPADSPVLSGGCPGAHGLQGLGAGFVPEILDGSLLDEVIPVGQSQAEAACKLLGRLEGIHAGPSSGAALHAAIELARRREGRHKRIAVIFPDGGSRYLSGK